MKNLPFWRAGIEEFLTQHIGTQSPVLDIGLGDSTFFLRNKGLEVHNLDKIVRPNSDTQWHADIMDISSMKDIPQYDTIICCEVFEHVERPFDAAQNIMSLVKPGGRCLVTVPCNLDWHPGEPHYGDFWRFMPSGITQLFAPYKVTEYPYGRNHQERRTFPLGICAVVFK